MSRLNPLAIIGTLLLLTAYAMLWPGLTEPMLSLKGTVEKAKLVDIGRDILRESETTSSLVRSLADRFISGLDTSGTIEAFDKTNSILGTAQELWDSSSRFVAVLIVTFSVIIPALKALLLLAAALPLNPTFRARTAAIADASGKWSMADVFVIAIFIAFLAGKGMSGSSGLVDFTAQIGPGFWWFLGYCLLSVLGGQLLSFSRHSKRIGIPRKKKKASKRTSAVRKKAATSTRRPASRTPSTRSSR